MLKSVRHEKVQVLNGGIKKTKKNNFPLSSNMEIVQSLSEPYPMEKWNLPTIEMVEIENILQNPNYLVIDVRDKGRYDGKFEPIDLVAGHIPGAINIPFTENLDQNGLFLKPDELRKKYELVIGKKRPKNIAVHCGSGVTACHTLLALEYAGFKIPNLYVGSWSEWSRNDEPIARNF